MANEIIEGIPGIQILVSRAGAYLLQVLEALAAARPPWPTAGTDSDSSDMAGIYSVKPNISDAVHHFAGVSQRPAAPIIAAWRLRYQRRD